MVLAILSGQFSDLESSAPFSPPRSNIVLLGCDVLLGTVTSFGKYVKSLCSVGGPLLQTESRVKQTLVGLFLNPLANFGHDPHPSTKANAEPAAAEGARRSLTQRREEHSSLQAKHSNPTK